MTTVDSFTYAWSEALPGPAVHPGPRTNAWNAKVRMPSAELEALPVGSTIRAIAWGDAFHPRATGDGFTSIRQRVIPSAGACYPVQFHVTCGEGCDLPAGIHAFDSETGTFATRHSDPGLLTHGCAIVVVSVLPHRTASRYHHRTLPLLLADVAYAVHGLTGALADSGVGTHPAQWDLETSSAAVALPLPHEWAGTWPGSAPEVPVAALCIGAPAPKVSATPARHGDPGSAKPHGITGFTASTDLAVTVAETLSTPLPLHPLTIRVATQGTEQRRSFPHPTTAPRYRVSPQQLGFLAESAAAIEPPPGCDVTTVGEPLGLVELATVSANQEWIRNVQAAVAFSSKHRPTPADVWWAASVGASLVYDARSWFVTRPIGGFSGQLGAQYPLHAIAINDRRSAP